MKLSKTLLVSVSIMALYFSVTAQAQQIVGTWQLVKQSTCLENSTRNQDDSLERLRNEMHSQAGATAQVVNFKSNSSGEESTRILSSSKAANSKKFLYKFGGDRLLILDKRSQTISDSYMVDKFTSDTLIVSNSSRPCETRIFVKIN
ncbi:MAG TPA: hypothetical protein VIQ51_04280 [Chryseosolibacter sp.]